MIFNNKIEQFVSDFDTSSTIIQSIADNGIGGSGPPSFFALILRMLFAMALIVLLIFILRWAMKRFLPKNLITSKNFLIEIISNKYIGAKKNILAVRVKDRILILGVTSSSITCLTEFLEEEMMENPSKEFDLVEDKGEI